MTGFDSWAVPCPRCRAEVGQPCRLVWWSRQREHAERFYRAWRLSLRRPTTRPAPGRAVPYVPGGFRCPRCGGAAQRAADFPAYVVCSTSGTACAYVYAAPSYPITPSKETDR